MQERRHQEKHPQAAPAKPRILTLIVLVLARRNAAVIPDVVIRPMIVGECAAREVFFREMSPREQVAEVNILNLGPVVPREMTFSGVTRREVRGINTPEKAK